MMGSKVGQNIRLVVTGGRDFHDRWHVNRVLTRIHNKHNIVILIQGGARGADQLCAEWAWDRDIPVATYNADWENDGRAAGVIRNQRMIDEGKPDAAVAFTGGRGTADMIKRLKKCEIPLWNTSGIEIGDQQ